MTCVITSVMGGSTGAKFCAPVNGYTKGIWVFIQLAVYKCDMLIITLMFVPFIIVTHT